MTYDTIKSPAKINLYLHITGKDRFNYHILDTLVCFLPDLHDNITVKEVNSSNHIIETTGPWQNHVTGTNILEKVLIQLADILQKKRFHITVEKNIPIGAGLGGGSSNAAYLINYLINKYNLPISKTQKIQICSKIGADVPLFTYTNALYAMGIGDIIRPTTAFPKDLFALIVFPKSLLSTKDIYNNYRTNFVDHIKHNYKLDIKSLLALLKHTKNDLYRSSLDFLPKLSNIITDIESLDGCLFSRMSGSGSSCFGIFQDQNTLKLAKSKLDKMMPNFFITQSRIQ